MSRGIAGPEAAGSEAAGEPTGEAACVLPDDEVLRDLGPEPTRRVVLRLAPHAAGLGPAQKQPLAGACESDIGQAPFLGQLQRVLERPGMRESTVLESGEEDDGELQPFGRV